MTATALEKAFSEGLQAAIPDGGMTISKWAEAYRHVERSARPGKWSNDVVPFLTEIMDVITEPEIREVVFMKSSQVGGSELAVNTVGYFIHIDPTYLMYLAEQQDKASAWTDESFDTTVAGTDVLKNLVRDDAKNNNQRIKRFPGGQLTIAWASSPAQLSSRPVRVIIFDEIDAYVVTKEGDAIKLGEARQKTFNDTKKTIKISSPRDRETSLIEPAYLAGDQREFYVPCPHCNEFQTLKWSNVKWETGEAESAYYVCDICGVMIDHEEKRDMLAKGRWIAGAETKQIASFKINELYSPFTTWGDIAADFLVAKNHPDTLKVWTNTRMGETWKAEETIDYLDLELHREDYGNVEVPAGVLILTAGVDVQGDRLELEIVGWGKNRENWSIDYQVFEGSPALPDVWKDLKDALMKGYTGDGRTFHVRAAAIDSGGGNTEDVYAFCKKHKGRGWFAVKGSSSPGNPLVKRGSLTKKERVRLWLVGTNTAKDEIFSFLRVADEGSPGYCHYPNDDEKYGELYLKQLCSEKKITRVRMGQSYSIYEKVSASVRNEALDVRVYATAARAIIFHRRDFDKWAERESKRKLKPMDRVPGPAEDVEALANSKDVAESSPSSEGPKQATPAPVRRRRKVRVKNNRLAGYKV